MVCFWLGNPNMGRIMPVKKELAFFIAVLKTVWPAPIKQVGIFGTLLEVK
jgi:hypothetical protein